MKRNLVFTVLETFKVHDQVIGNFIVWFDSPVCTSKFVLYCYILRRERMLWPHTEEEMEGEKRVKLHLPGINPFIRAFLNASNT